jgi:hypothetical protein
MAAYPFHQRDIVERNVDSKGCKYMCSYTDLCTTELMGGNTTFILGKTMKVGDPQDYYEDRAGDVKGGE